MRFSQLYPSSSRYRTPSDMDATLAYPAASLEEASSSIARCVELSPSEEELSPVIALLRNSTHNLSRQMNMRSGINQLPAEVLMQIFTLLQNPPSSLDPSIVGACGPFKIKENPNRLPILQVCRSWYEVALATPALWSSFSSRSPAARAYNSLIQAAPHSPTHLDPLYPPSNRPLYLHMQLPDHAPLTHRLLHRARHRVKELHIDVLKPWSENPFLALLPFPAPELCRLVLYGRDSAYFDGPQTGATPPAARRGFSRDRWCGPQLLCGGHTPRLTTLALVDLPFLPARFGASMPSLTHFTFVFRSIDGVTCSTRELLAFLANTPALQELYLNSPLREDRARDPPVNSLVSNEQARQPVRLDHLRRLSILTVRNRRCSAYHCETGVEEFFSRLALPQACCVRFSADMDCLRHITSVAKCAQRLEWDEINLHCVVQRRRLGGGMSFQIASSNHGGGFRLDLSPNGRLGDKVPRMEAITAVLSLPPFVHASQIWLSGSAATNTPLLRGGTSLSALISPKALYLVDVHSFNQNALRGLWPSSCYSSSAIVPMPSLETVYVHIPVDDEIGLVQFAVLLQARAGAGCRLERLYVRTTPRLTLCPGDDIERWARKIRYACSAHVDEVVVGETVYEPLSLSRALPQVCTDSPQAHAFWPLWVEGVTVDQETGTPDASFPAPLILEAGDDRAAP
ncbi:hypothetical protein OH77DRAFT_934836 [Trametes cingulata]|nr:hypothetical protein OH77DRAFT_934836 [Trametes cingulata]